MIAMTLVAIVLEAMGVVTWLVICAIPAPPTAPTPRAIHWPESTGTDLAVGIAIVTGLVATFIGSIHCWF